MADTGFLQAYARTMLDAQISNDDYLAWSANGSSETANVARTAVAAWDAATDTDPPVRSNTNALTSAACATAETTVTHFAIFSASTEGTQKTVWTELADSRTLAVGDKLSVAAGAIEISLQ